MTSIDISTFRRKKSGWESLNCFLVIKSLDQIDRRKRMIEAKKRGTIGRISPRPVAKGLLVETILEPGTLINEDSVKLCQFFKEPRGLTRIDRRRFLITEIACVVELDLAGNIYNHFSNPYFAYLHSIDYHREKKTFLVASSGYDSLIEFSLESGKLAWEWFAWDYGFTALDGTCLVRNQDEAMRLSQSGKKVKLIDPTELGEQGILTSQRANHPNSACYNPYKEHCVVATLGHSGEIIEIDQKTQAFQIVCTGLSPMPHGIQPYLGGWMVTNTTCGEFWILNQKFQLKEKYILANLPEKVTDANGHEWIQEVVPLQDDQFLAIDANRGLVLLDTRKKEYDIIKVDPNWCIHHALVFNGKN